MKDILGRESIESLNLDKEPKRMSNLSKVKIKSTMVNQSRRMRNSGTNDFGVGTSKAIYYPQLVKVGESMS